MSVSPGHPSAPESSPAGGEVNPTLAPDTAQTQDPVLDRLDTIADLLSPRPMQRISPHEVQSQIDDWEGSFPSAHPTPLRRDQATGAVLGPHTVVLTAKPDRGVMEPQPPLSPQAAFLKRAEDTWKDPTRSWIGRYIGGGIMRAYAASDARPHVIGERWSARGRERGGILGTVMRLGGAMIRGVAVIDHATDTIKLPSPDHIGMFDTRGRRSQNLVRKTNEETGEEEWKPVANPAHARNAIGRRRQVYPYN